MRCAECGAELPGEERCKDRFHALLAAEQHHPEAAAMHGLFVLAYHAQHPSLCKPWLRSAHREVPPRDLWEWQAPERGTLVAEGPDAQTRSR